MFTRRRFFKRLVAAANQLPRAGPAQKDTRAAARRALRAHELKSEVVIIGGSFGGVAAALAIARAGYRVILTEETDWLGGQATTQGVPLDEHPWIEHFGRTQSYADFRNGVRAYYRRHYPLIPAAHQDPTLNPGAGWASALCFEPRAGLAVLYEMLAPHIAAGRLRVLTRHRPIAVDVTSDHVRAVQVHDAESGHARTLWGTYFLDATDLGELLELGGIEHVIGAESQAETGEPNALSGPADPAQQNSFTQVFAMDYRPGEEHVIDRPRDYDFWRRQVRRDNGSPKLPVADLFSFAHDQQGRPIRNLNDYRFSPWSMRRMLCRSNFAEGAFASDITAGIWLQNAYDHGPLCGVSQAVAQSHRDAAKQLSLSLLYWLQTEAPDLATGRSGFPGLRLRDDVFGTTDGLAPYPYIRESRRIRAEFTVNEQHFLRDVPATRQAPLKYGDSVGVSGYRVDLVRVVKSGRNFAQENQGRHWCQQIPLGALIPVRIQNLLPACKNLGATAVMSGALRVHPTEWNVGEAAGMAAAYCLQRGVNPRQLRATRRHLADFQRELLRQGVELDWPRNDYARSYFGHVSATDPDWYYGEASRRK